MRKPWVVYLFMAILVTVYVIAYVNAPISIYATADKDDGMFITLGRHLANGQWLGPYNQFTLVKGPGYPALLAASSWLGISVLMAHALVHCGAVSTFVVLSHRFIKSLLISAVLFLLLLGNPTLFGGLLRVFRDPIYSGQVLVFFAAFAYALLAAESRAQRIFYAVLAGLFLGWLWLTREEGLWVVPAAMLLAAAALLRAFRLGSSRNVVGVLLITLVVFATLQAGFRGLNWWHYGKFVGVEFKEANFENAVRQLQGVRSGGVIPGVSVTRAARAQIYPVSPTFATLKGYLDGSVGESWEQYSCSIIPGTCGEISAGLFIWMLRDAATVAGHHKTPTDASNFYGQIAAEVSAACANGALDCNPQMLALMPQTDWQQLSQFPQHLYKAFHLLIWSGRGLDGSGPSTGNEELLGPGLRFLNYPLHTKTSDMPARTADLPTDQRHAFSRHVRLALIQYYNVIFVPVLAIGLAAFAVASVRYWKTAIFNACYVMACAAWLLVLTRVSLIVLLELAAYATAFNLVYLMPAHFLMACGAAFSLGAWLQLSKSPSRLRDYFARLRLNWRKRSGTARQDGSSAPAPESARAGA
jgi:hypothetical protein